MKLYPNTNINQITVGHATRGWVCDLWFSCEVHTQFTMARYEVRGYGRKGWHGLAGLLLSVIDALRNYIITAHEQQAVQGGFNNA